MKYLKQQNGYALLVTLLILVVFSVLGTTLMMLTLNGGSKNEVREDITQSADLSQKGIDLLTTQINSDLTTYLGTNGRTRTDFVFQLERYLNDYLCTGQNSLLIPTATGNYKACIESYVDSVGENNEVNKLKKLVTVKSIGKSGKSTRELVSKIEIGAESAPEALRYAIGTNITSPPNSLTKGEGNLILHGGVDIKGDIKVDGNIITGSQGYAFLEKERWIPSVAPSALPLEGEEKSRLFLGGNAYTLAYNPTISYSTHIENNNFTNANYTLSSNINTLFRDGASPELVTREPVQTPVGITNYKSSFEYDKSSPNTVNLTIENSNKILNNLNSNYYKNNKFFLSARYDKRVCKVSILGACLYYGVENTYEEGGTYTFNGTNNFKQVSTKGNVNIIDSDTTFKNGLYVEGDMIIGNGITSDDIDKYSDITLDGPIYVNGNVTIKGADLNSNVLLYVDGTLTIEYSRINGKSLTISNQSHLGSLIVFATENIYIRNNSLNLEYPSNVKGFFYSEENFEMFGVGSNMLIDGGISAKRIVLNAIRGRSSNDKFSNAYDITYRDSKGKMVTDYFEGITEQQKSTSKSRLQVIYDEEIISTYSDLKQQEPIIYRVDPPLEKDRSY